MDLAGISGISANGITDILNLSILNWGFIEDVLSIQVHSPCTIKQ